MSSALALKNAEAAARTAEGLRRQAIASASKNPNLGVAQLAQMLAAQAGANMFAEEAIMLAIAEEADKSGDMVASKKIRDAATEFRVRANKLPVLGTPEANAAAVSALAKQMMDKHYPQASRSLDGFDGLDGFGSWIRGAVKKVGSTVTRVVRSAPAAMANVTLFPIHSIVKPLAWAGIPAAKQANQKLNNLNTWMEHNPGKTLLGQAAIAAAAVGGGALIAGAGGAAGAGAAAATTAATTAAGAGTAAAGTGITVGGALTTATQIAPIAIGVAKGIIPSKPPAPPAPAEDPSIPTSIVNPDGTVLTAVPDGSGGVKYVPVDPKTGAPRYSAASMFNIGKNWPYWLAGISVLGVVALIAFRPRRGRAALRLPPATAPGQPA